MSEYPDWDYWRWKPETDHIDWELEGALVMGTLGLEDLRREDKSCDVDVHVRRPSFWNAHEAACLAFGRDPKQVDLSEDGFAEDPTEESGELRQYIASLKETIEEHQAARNLPRGAFSKTLFLEWAEAMKVDCSHLERWLGLNRRPEQYLTSCSMSELDQPDAAITREALIVQPDSEDKLVTPKERRSLYTMLLAMSKVKYGHNPAAGNSGSRVSNIVRDIDLEGYKIDEGTVKRHLDAAWAMLKT